MGAIWGFVRDIIAGIPYEELITKDVDIYFRYHQGYFHRRSAHDEAHLMIDQLITRPNVEVIKYGKKCSEDVPFTEYAIVKVKYNGIVFDIGFECKNNRFEYNFDFTCNSLYCAVDDGILRQRISSSILIDGTDLSIERCINDIKERRLISLISLIKVDFRNYHCLHHIRKRSEKMITYGYQPNSDDDQIMKDIYLDRLTKLEKMLKYDNEEIIEKNNRLKEQLKKLKLINKEQKSLLISLSSMTTVDDQILTSLFGLNAREKIIREEIKMIRYPIVNHLPLVDMIKDLM